MAIRLNNPVYRNITRWPAPAKPKPHNHPASKLITYCLRRLLQHGGYRPRNTVIASQRLACFLPEARLAVAPDFSPISDSILAGIGIFVLRFTRDDILANPERVLLQVQEACLERNQLSPPPTNGPDPQGGNPDRCVAHPKQDARKPHAGAPAPRNESRSSERVSGRTNDANAATT